jgi:hypothetical protein
LYKGEVIMPATLTIQGKRLGSKRPLFPDRLLPYPRDLGIRGGQTTLGDLIGEIVRQEVTAFRERQDERRLFQVLSHTEIAQGAMQGKIDPGGRDLEQEVDMEAAVTTASQAFEDGLYYVFVDGEQQDELDTVLTVQPDSTVTFVRLVALAGG